MKSASPTVELLGIRLSKWNLPQTLDFLAQQNETTSGYICFANVHTVTEGQWNKDLRSALNHATLAVADGVPLVWLSRMLGEPVAGRVCGPDFMEQFIKMNPSLPYGLIGGAPGVANTLAMRLNMRAAVYSPPHRPFSPEHVAEDLQNFSTVCEQNQLGPKIVWVGLGAPKQELWMAVASKIRPDLTFLGVGAAFDLLSGRRRRAPVFFQRMGLEWLYRLCQEPRRLARRYLVTNFVFTLMSLRKISQTLLFGPAKSLPKDQNG